MGLTTEQVRAHQRGIEPRTLCVYITTRKLVKISLRFLPVLHGSRIKELCKRFESWFPRNRGIWIGIEENP